MKPFRAKKVKFFSVFLAVFVCLMATNSALAQTSNAEISGTVVDSSGAAVASAAVTVTNLETGAVRTAATDDAGVYRILSLPVGRHEVKVEKVGFNAAVQTGLNLVVGQQAIVNVTLNVGVVSQQVTVTAEAQLINTTTAPVSGLVGEQQIKDLPLNGRSYDNLITLNPAATNFTSEKTYGFSGVGQSFTIAGRRQWENLYMLNGIEYTGASIILVTPGGVSGEMLGIDATREFNVVSGAYSAQYGKRSGGQISVVTQSGSNELHGSVFEFLRNSALDARNAFDKGSVPPFKRNQFGGALGGPIIKNRTFLFGNYEGFRQRLGLSVLSVVPDLNARQGLLPNSSGVPTLVTGLQQGMLAYLQNLWPAPNGTNLGGGVAQSFNNPSQSVTEDFGTVRLDHNISSRDSFSAVYTIDSGISTTPIAADPIFKQDLYLRAQVLSLQEVHTFSPQVINTFTFGLSRAAFTYNNIPSFAAPANVSFMAGLPPGSISVGGGQSGGSTLTNGVPANPRGYVYRTLFTYQDGIQIVKGRHQISIGGLVQRIRSNERTAARSLGQATFTNLTTFLQGTASVFTVAPNQIPQDWRQLEGGWYVQDSVRLSPRLTITAGLRHELTNGWTERTGRGAYYQLDSNGVPLTTPVLTSQLFPQNDAKKLFSPRIGLAWDPFGKGKTSVRAGAGIYYNLVDTSIAAGSTNNNPPFNGAATYSNYSIITGTPLNPGIALPVSCGPGVPQPCTTYSPRGNDSHLKTPTVQSWEMTVEQQITSNMVLRVGYIGSVAYHQFINLDSNAVRTQICSNSAGCTSGGIGSVTGTVPVGAEYLPVVATRPNPFLNTAVLTFFSGTANYNALTVDLERRMTNGLQFRANFTWSKNLDEGSGVGGSQALNSSMNILVPTDIRRDYGVSVLHVPRQAAGYINYDLPFGRGRRWLKGVNGVGDKLISGWRAGTIVSLASGFWLTPLVGSNRSGNGDNSVVPDRPNINTAFTGNVKIGSQAKWFDSAAYSLPIAGTYGNLPRGTLEGPGLAMMDFSLSKETKISERVGLEFRAEIFNLPNHTNFGNPNLGVFSGTASNPSAGLITTTSTSSRQAQFGLKLLF